MPTFKHPCPHCGKYINRDVAICPYCATPDPFAPVRCPNCRTVIEDPGWAACPRCGQMLPLRTPGPTQEPAPMRPGQLAPPPGPAPTPIPGPPPVIPAQPASAQATPASKCSGCGAPLAPGARFCTVCGTLAT